MILGDTTLWCVQYPITSTLAGWWHCYACVACDAETGTGPAFELGIYDPSVGNLTYPLSETIDLENGAGDGKYHTYDLGDQQLKVGDYFWFAPIGNSGSPNVYVDSITLTQD